MAQRNPANRVISDGGVVNGQDGPHIVGFPDGLDSFVHPLSIKPTQLRWIENGVTRGGLPQVRPGYLRRFLFDMSTNSVFYNWWVSVGQPILHPQMGTYFQPSYGQPQKIICVSGSVWALPVNPDGSFGTPILVAAQAFSQFADIVNGCLCIQAATIQSGVYVNNIAPRKIIVLQDGMNRACIWDGTSFQRMNPQKNVTVDANGDTLYTAGWNEIPIGLWMMWSGDRLWVFTGPVGRSSDLQDPTHFTEEMRLDSGGQWLFPQDVTGAIDRGVSGTTRSLGIVFTLDFTFSLLTGVQQRFPSSAGVGGWVNTADFKATLFSGVGCIAGRTPIVHRGLLYWMSADGIVVFDSTGTVFSTQNLPPIDQEMSYSKRRMGSNRAGCCAGYRDSYVFWSVPVGQTTNGRPYNGHTQVLDRQTTVVHTLGLNGPFTYGTIGWQGVWTGIRPVQWSTFEVGGVVRPYALSMDQDGQIRIWEAFQGNRTDNGEEIPWSMETRLHPVASTIFETSIFRHARAVLDQIIGNITVGLSWRGMRGAYKPLCTYSYTATPGSLLTPVAPYRPLKASNPVWNFLPQTRDLISPDWRGANVDSTCQSTNVEAPYADSRDHAFGLLFNMTGRCSVVAYRIAADTALDDTDGIGNFQNETGFKIVPGGGCPQSIAGGAPPDYELAPASPGDAFSPVVPAYDGSDPIYVAPSL